jgi:hypothetical protein
MATVVERTFAWLNQGRALICWRFLQVDWVAERKLALPAIH